MRMGNSIKKLILNYKTLLNNINIIIKQLIKINLFISWAKNKNYL